MESGLTIALAVMAGVTIMAKVYLVQMRRWKIRGVSGNVRTYRDAEKTLKSVLQEETHVCAKEQKLTSDCTRLVTRIRKLERRLRELEDDDQAVSGSGRRKARVLR